MWVKNQIRWNYFLENVSEIKTSIFDYSNPRQQFWILYILHVVPPDTHNGLARGKETDFSSEFVPNFLLIFCTWVSTFNANEINKTGEVFFCNESLLMMIHNGKLSLPLNSYRLQVCYPDWPIINNKISLAALKIQFFTALTKESKIN